MKVLIEWKSISWKTPCDWIFKKSKLIRINSPVWSKKEASHRSSGIHEREREISWVLLGPYTRLVVVSHPLGSNPYHISFAWQCLTSRICRARVYNNCFSIQWKQNSNHFLFEIFFDALEHKKMDSSIDRIKVHDISPNGGIRCIIPRGRYRKLNLRCWSWMIQETDATRSSKYLDQLTSWPQYIKLI